MVGTFEADDWRQYQMSFSDPHRELEPVDSEIAVVEAVLSKLRQADILPQTAYDRDKMLAHRQAVRELFDIPWTAITPRMERLLYAINAVVQPDNMIAAGVFCGNTFICNAGAAVGPGACYTAENLVGLEIEQRAAETAERNVRRIDRTGVARVVAADAVDFVAQFHERIDLLYLDADGDGTRGQGIYLEILEACYRDLPEGSVLLAHNSVNGGSQIGPYLDFVRDPKHCRSSVNVVFDPEGLEVSIK